MDVMSFLRWFSGGEMQYHDLWHCMRGDVLWVVITVVLDLAVAAGYVIIAMHWMRNERFLPDSPAKRAMAAMKNIFILCGICGYVFIPIKLFWPAWRLYDMVLLVLAFYTWKYAWGAKDLKVVYNELGRTSQLAKELEASRAEVEKRSEFLNAVSHDLRTPLNGLTLRTDLAEMQLGMNDGDGLKQSLEDIRASARSVAEMLDVLLDYARVDRDRTKADDRFSVRALIGDVLRDIAPAAEQKGLALHNNVPDRLVIVTDRMKLRRILANLVGNAVKFTRTGSVRVEAEWRGPNIELHVIDTGVGMSPEQASRVFEEFYQVGNEQRSQSRGFGMGLPIAKQLAERLGGEIQVASSEGRGSRFSVVLPGAIDVGEERGKRREESGGA